MTARSTAQERFAEILHNEMPYFVSPGECRRIAALLATAEPVPAESAGEREKALEEAVRELLPIALIAIATNNNLQPPQRQAIEKARALLQSPPRNKE